MIDVRKAKKNTTTRIVAAYFTTLGAPKTGGSVSVRVVRAGDGKYLQSDGSWAASPLDDPAATEWSSTNSPGIYYFDFQLPDAFDFYVITFDMSSGTSTRFQYTSLEAVAADEADLRKAAAILGNRQEQDIATGIVTVMDDDGETPLLSLTPSVDDVDSPTKNILTVSDA